MLSLSIVSYCGQYCIVNARNRSESGTIVLGKRLEMLCRITTIVYQRLIILLQLIGLYRNSGQRSVGQHLFESIM